MLISRPVAIFTALTIWPFRNSVGGEYTRAAAPGNSSTSRAPSMTASARQKLRVFGFSALASGVSFGASLLELSGIWFLLDFELQDFSRARESAPSNRQPWLKFLMPQSPTPSPPDAMLTVLAVRFHPSLHNPRRSFISKPPFHGMRRLPEPNAVGSYHGSATNGLQYIWPRPLFYEQLRRQIYSAGQTTTRVVRRSLRWDLCPSDLPQRACRRSQGAWACPP